MDTVTLIGVAAAAILGITCAGLALWCGYRDGVLGHLALAVVACCALVVVLEATEVAEYELLPTTAGMIVAMACFMARHAWRAWRFRNHS